jgi:hypothetical protein
MWKRAEKEITPSPDDQLQVAFIDMALSSLQKYNKTLVEDMKKDTFSIESLEKYQPVSLQAKQAKTGFLTYMKLFTFDSGAKNADIIKELEDYVDQSDGCLPGAWYARERYHRRVAQWDRCRRCCR